MRALLAVLAMVIVVPSLSLAQEKSGKFEIRGYYGTGFADAKDLNVATSFNGFRATGSNNISSETSYGGGILFRLGSKVKLALSYENTAADNVKGNGGYTIAHNEGWADLHFMLARGKVGYLYLGAGGGYPVGSTVTVKSTGTSFTPTAQVGYRGVLGFGAMLGNHFTLFVEGMYQVMDSGAIGTLANGIKTNATTVANLNLTGPKAVAGLGLVF